MPFFTDVLERKAQDLANAFPNLRRYQDLREAIDGACNQYYAYLPLLTATFTNFDVAEALGERGAIVVAEQVVRVPDPNRPPANRVDFFCYRVNGDVVRHHPGRSEVQSMKPHSMPLGSFCFQMALAAEQGVGACLHARPPRLVQWRNRRLLDQNAAGAAQPGEPPHHLATRADLDALCGYDIQCVNWKAVREKLFGLPDHDHTVNWSDGSHFPWWVWLANTGAVRDVVNDGVTAVELEVRNGNKCVLVHSGQGPFRLSCNARGKMVIDPTPGQRNR